MSSPSRIAQLAAIISTNTSIIDNYLITNDLPQPSFSADALPWDPSSLPAEIQTAKLAVEDATLELQDLLAGPSLVAQKAVTSGITDFSSIHRFSIPHKIPLNDPNGISYAELAKETGVNENALARILRLAISHRVFTEPKPGYIAHSAASKLMATDSEFWDWVGLVSRYSFLTIKFLGEALHRFPAADELEETAACCMLGIQEEQGFFEYMQSDPEAWKMFVGAMGFIWRTEGYELKYLVDGFEWGSLPAGSTVVDLGGCHGDAAVAIAKEHEDLKLVVQDLLHTIATAPGIPEGLNVKLQVHDFFKEQPIHGAAVYLFRRCWHNWPDKYCVEILQALIPALKRGSRVLVMDAVMPPIGSGLSNVEEREVRFQDVIMLSLFNAGDREADGYRAIFTKADARFRLAGVTAIQGSKLSLVEAVWEG